MLHIRKQKHNFAPHKTLQQKAWWNICHCACKPHRGTNMATSNRPHLLCIFVFFILFCLFYLIFVFLSYFCGWDVFCWQDFKRVFHFQCHSAFKEVYNGRVYKLIIGVQCQVFGIQVSTILPSIGQWMDAMCEFINGYNM